MKLACALPLTLLMIAAPGCKPAAPATPVEPPRLAAEEGCATEVVAAAPLPVPRRPPPDPYRLPAHALLGFTDTTGFHPATHICDLPDRILVTAAEQGVEGGKRRIAGTVTTIARTPGAALPPQAIEPGSEGCLEGAFTCSWQTAAPALARLETVRGQRVPTSGWVHGADDLCRALPDDTIATCSTATRLAYVEVGCQATADGPVALQLGLHDASLERRYGLDVEVPVARLTGAAEHASGTSYRYRFTGPGGAPTGAGTEAATEAGRQGQAPSAPRTALLAFNLTGPSATLTLDGVVEPCLGFGLYRIP